MFHDAGSRDETAWIDFLASDAALIESTMAIGIRNWCNGISFQSMAEVHSSRASSIMIHRIQNGTPYTDAMLATVFTMAFGERLRHDDVAWSIHVYGLAQLIGERYSQGVHHLPPWFLDLLVLYAIPCYFPCHRH
jgi:hypothetical protein